MNVYRFPNYYEIAFSFRDPRKDMDFLEEAIAEFSKVRVRSVLELASGLSPYLGEWHRRGYRYFGLDLSTAMIAAARKKAREDGIPLRVFRRNMNLFRLPGVKVELAYVLLGSMYSVGHRAKIPAARPRRIVWLGLPLAGRSYGHSGVGDGATLTLTEPLRRACHRIDPARVPRPHRHLQRTSLEARPDLVCRLLSPLSHPSVARQRLP